VLDTTAPESAATAAVVGEAAESTDETDKTAVVAGMTVAVVAVAGAADAVPGTAAAVVTVVILDRPLQDHLLLILGSLTPACTRAGQDECAADMLAVCPALPLTFP